MSEKQEIDLEKELSHFNGHYGYEHRELGEKLEEIELELECLTLGEGARSRGDNLFFMEHEGELYFTFVSCYKDCKLIRYGKISERVRGDGESAIRDHTEGRMHAATVPYKRMIDAHDAFCSNSNVSVTIEYDGIELRGRILSGDGRYYHLRMEHPYQVEVARNGGYNQWSAQSGVFMFGKDEQGMLCYSRDCIENAQRKLIELYKDRKYQERNSESIALVDSLNRTNKPFNEKE